MELLNAILKLFDNILVSVLSVYFFMKSFRSLHKDKLEAIYWAILFLTITLYVIFINF